MIALLPQGFGSTQVLAPMLMAAGAIGMVMLLVTSVRKRLAVRATKSSPREIVEQSRQARGQPRLDDTRPAAGRAQSEAQAAAMVDLSRRLAAQLDNKAQRLETLIRQADERIGRLGGAGAASHASPAARGSAAPPARAQAATAPRPMRSEASRSVDPVTRAVYDLADQGRSPVEIAQALDEQVGKVELILALRAA